MGRYTISQSLPAHYWEARVVATGVKGNRIGTDAPCLEPVQHTRLSHASEPTNESAEVLLASTLRGTPAAPSLLGCWSAPGGLIRNGALRDGAPVGGAGHEDEGLFAVRGHRRRRAAGTSSRAVPGRAVGSVGLAHDRGRELVAAPNAGLSAALRGMHSHRDGRGAALGGHS